MFFASLVNRRAKSRRPLTHQTPKLSVEDLEGRLVPSDLPTSIGPCDGVAGRPCVVKPGFPPDSLLDLKLTTGQQGDGARAADQAVDVAAALPKPPTELWACGGPVAAPCALKPGEPPAAPAADAAVMSLLAADVKPPEREPPTELFACAGSVRRVCLDKNGDPLPPALGQTDADAALVAALVAGDTATLTPQRPIPVFEPVAAQPANLPPTTMIGSDNAGTSGSTSIVDSAKIQ